MNNTLAIPVDILYQYFHPVLCMMGGGGGDGHTLASFTNLSFSENMQLITLIPINSSGTVHIKPERLHEQILSQSVLHTVRITLPPFNSQYQVIINTQLISLCLGCFNYGTLPTCKNL